MELWFLYFQSGSTRYCLQSRFCHLRKAYIRHFLVTKSDSLDITIRDWTKTFLFDSISVLLEVDPPYRKSPYWGLFRLQEITLLFCGIFCSWIWSVALESPLECIDRAQVGVLQETSQWYTIHRTYSRGKLCFGKSFFGKLWYPFLFLYLANSINYKVLQKSFIKYQASDVIWWKLFL